jgi:hypothetical protein
VNANIQINSGGSISGNGVNYGGSAFIYYNTGATSNPGSEWLTGASSGAGVPQNVTIGKSQNGTTNTNTIISFGSDASYRQLLGNLLIGGGTSTGHGLQLSSASGGDIKVGGNFTASTTTSWSSYAGGFNGNGRTVFMTANATQTITGPSTGSTLTIPYLVLGTNISTYAGTSAAITLSSNLNVTAPADGIAIAQPGIPATGATSTNNHINLNTYTLTVGTAGQSVSCSSTSNTANVLYVKGSGTTNNGALVFNGNAGTITLNIDNGGGNSQINTITVNHPGVTLVSKATLGGDLSLQSGTFTFAPTTATYLYLYGNIASNGGNLDVSATNGTLVFKGNSAQSIASGSITGTIANLDIQNQNTPTPSAITSNTNLNLTSIHMSTGISLDLCC